MGKTKIMQFRVEEEFFRLILNRAHSKGYNKYSEYIRDLCEKDSMDSYKIHEKLNKIIDKLSMQ